MGYFGRKKSISDEEEAEIRKFVQETFEKEDLNFVIPQNYPKIAFKFTMKRFNLTLTKTDPFEDHRQEIFLQTKNLKLQFYVKQNGMKAQADLKGLKVGYFEKNALGTTVKRKL